jgi:choline monooxygenase
VFLGFHCDHFWTRIIEPVAPDQTRDHLQIYYLGDAAQSDDYEQERKVRMDTWAEVFYEDIGVVQGMQRGRQSPAFSGGVFTPLMDEPSHHFARWVASQL